MAWTAASSTACGGGKSGSPTQRDVTDIPSASICFTLEKIWTVADGLTFCTRGLISMEEEDCDDDDDDDDDDGVFVSSSVEDDI